MDPIKKIFTFIILLGAAFWYYNHNTEKVDQWLKERNIPNPTQLFSTSGATQQLQTLKDQVSSKWTSEFVLDQFSRYVVKDGISLPEGWKLETRVIKDLSLVVIVPPDPQGQDDYIAPRVPRKNVELLPNPYLCTDASKASVDENLASNTTTVCVVGTNLETHKVFYVLTFVKNKK